MLELGITRYQQSMSEVVLSEAYDGEQVEELLATWEEIKAMRHSWKSNYQRVVGLKV